MFEAHGGFEVIEEGFDEEAPAQEDFVEPWHEIIFHVLADARDEMEALLPELAEEFFADIALVGKEFTGKGSDHVPEGCAVGCIARRDFNGHDFPLVIDDDMQLKAIEPAHGGLASCGEALEDLVAADPLVMTDRQLC